MTVITIPRRKLIIENRSPSLELSFVPINRLAVLGDLTITVLLLVMLVFSAAAGSLLFHPGKSGDCAIGCFGLILFPMWAWIFVNTIRAMFRKTFVKRTLTFQNSALEIIDASRFGHRIRTVRLSSNSTFIYSEIDRRSLCTLWCIPEKKSEILESGLSHKDAEQAMDLLNQSLEQAFPERQPT